MGGVARARGPDDMPGGSGRFGLEQLARCCRCPCDCSCTTVYTGAGSVRAITRMCTQVGNHTPLARSVRVDIIAANLSNSGFISVEWVGVDFLMYSSMVDSPPTHCVTFLSQVKRICLLVECY